MVLVVVLSCLYLFFNFFFIIIIIISFFFKYYHVVSSASLSYSLRAALLLCLQDVGTLGILSGNWRERVAMAQAKNEGREATASSAAQQAGGARIGGTLAGILQPPLKDLHSTKRTVLHRK